MIGAVVIGRNEGPRLQQCLQSIVGQTRAVVYVDSGSTDDSLEIARRMDVETVMLDLRVPFTAARARNDGFRRLLERYPGIGQVQFVDGDCELVDGWLRAASAFLDSHPGVAVVAGRLRERFPDATVYNMLCDMEWDRSSGETKDCGGIAMMRMDALRSVAGFRTDLIAGEEPELCVRLRAAGWRIWRLDAEMALHDAAMRRFGQWWRRAMRTGYAYAQGAHLHGAPPERHRVRESRSAWFWGLGLPAIAIGAAPLLGVWTLAFLGAYPLQMVRLALGGERPWRENCWRAGFLVLGKFPEMLGQLKFLAHRLRGRQAQLIEYK